MYLISILEHDNSVFSIAVDETHVFRIIYLLENSERVKKFKVSIATGAVSQQAFGFGDCIKWVESFTGN